MKQNLQWIGTSACILAVGFGLGFSCQHKLYKESWEEMERREKEVLRQERQIKAAADDSHQKPAEDP